MPASDRRLAFVLIAAALLAACSSPSRFSEDNARAHVRMLATTIGSRPAGTDANRRAREYIIEQARRSGFDVRVQEADGIRPLYGASARVRNIIATKPGRRGHAIALVSHYDSVPDGPGAADAALGVAVCLEAGRVLAERASPNYALAIIITDGEELGLMGASALLKDPIVGWIRVVLNFEAVGSGGPALLFETTPAAGAVMSAWTREAWRPAGASFMADIYKRLPADTDLTLFRRAGLPGVNFAPAGDSYTYHTPRDSLERLDAFTLKQMGENAIRVAEALDRTDLSTRTSTPSTYFDVAGTFAVSYGTRTAAVLLAVALLAAVFGWIQTLAAARKVAGLGRTALTAVWSVVGLGAVGGFMVGGAWLMRATRESYHPWYAHPDRFFLFEILAGIFGGWIVMRVGSRLPQAARGSTHPAVLWAIILPVWSGAAIAAQVFAPSAAYAVVVPLIAAGAAVAVFSTSSLAAARVASVVAFVAAALVWIPNVPLLGRFLVPLFGRLPLVTPIWVYPALLLVSGLFLVPPLLALMARHEWDRGWSRTILSIEPGRALLAAALAGAAALCWFTPAYTHDHPLQRTIRYVHDEAAGQSYWEVGGSEPGIGVERGAPVRGGWQPSREPFRIGTPLDQLRWPFAYRAQSSVREPAPMKMSSRMTCDDRGCTAEMTATPSAGGLVAIFTLPSGVEPQQTNLPGVSKDGAFRSIYAAVPAEGTTLRVRVSRADARRMSESRVVVVNAGLPGASWPRLPAWLPDGPVVWHARSYFVIPVAFEVH